MSKQSNLLLRNGRFYFRTRVPKDLVTIIGKKEIKKALGTSNRSEAKRRLPIEQLEAEETFEKARNTRPAPQPLPILLDRTSIERRVILWHQNEITKHATEDDTFRVNSSVEERIQIIDNLREDLSVFDGGDESQYAGDIQKKVKNLFPDLDNHKQKEEYRFAQSLMHQSLIEQTFKRLERLGDTYKRIPYQLFLTRNEQLLPSQVNQSSQLTWGAVLAKFKAAKKSDGLTDKTLAGYKLAFDFSLELFGKNKPLSSISTEDCREFRDKLQQLPSNAKKRYPHLSLIDSIEAHSKKPTGTLSIISINGNLNKLSATLKFAVQEGYLKKNPCEHVPNLKQKKKKTDGKKSFSEQALSTLFQAPIYTGCVDDEWNYKTAGTNKPRRHKFWIPLISLYTGMRLNEICQLFTSDITCIEGVNVIQVQLDDNNEKSLKNASSERDIPIHKQLIKIGFLDYVNKIKIQGHKRLFPDLPQSAGGSYSDNFSKWFSRFLNSLNIKNNGVCFHSFRHGFRDAIREAQIPKELGAALGGWKASKDVMDDYGIGYKLTTLSTHLQKIQYGTLCELISTLNRNDKNQGQ
ncbi:DUF6538 domain-containing protein [Colwellia sp. RE-S-Sl-9]